MDILRSRGLGIGHSQVFLGVTFKTDFFGLSKISVFLWVL